MSKLTFTIQAACPTCGDGQGWLDAEDKPCEQCDEGLIDVELPAVYAVCHQCSGSGSHVNPNIDGNGLTQEDFDEDPDFKEAYFAGAYDVTCSECKGLRVVPTVDEVHLTEVQLNQLAAHDKRLSQLAMWDAEDRHTRRMESGGGDW